MRTAHRTQVEAVAHSNQTAVPKKDINQLQTNTRTKSMILDSYPSICNHLDFRRPPTIPIWEMWHVKVMAEGHFSPTQIIRALMHRPIIMLLAVCRDGWSSNPQILVQKPVKWIAAYLYHDSLIQKYHTGTNLILWNIYSVTERYNLVSLPIRWDSRINLWLETFRSEAKEEPVQ